MMTLEGLLSCTEIAKRTDRDKETIRKWCREGRLPSAFKIGNEWLVKEEDLVKLDWDK